MTGYNSTTRNSRLNPKGTSRLLLCRLAFLVVALLLPLTASAQMTLISQVRTVDSLAEIEDDNTGDIYGWGDFSASADFLPFTEYLSTYASDAFGYTDSEASQESTLDPDSLWVASYAYTDAEFFDPGYTNTTSAASNFEIEFSVAQPTNWSLDGTLEAHANGRVDLSLVDSMGTPIFSQSWVEMFPPLLVAESGTLAPGTYTLLISTDCYEDIIEPGFYAASMASVDVQFSVTGGGISSVGDASRRGLQLSAGPNPMQNKTTISFAGAPGQNVAVDVFDVRGRLVRRLQEAGGSQGQVAWDGRDDAGQNVPQGMYFVRMRGGNDILQRKVTVIR